MSSKDKSIDTPEVKKKSIFTKTLNAVKDFFYKINSSKAIVAVKNTLAYVPKKLTQNLKYDKKKAIWGIVFIIPLLIGFGYFFLIPFITTVVYSFSYVQSLGNNPVTGDFIGITTEGIGFDNYQYVLNQHTTFKETIVSSFGSTILEVPLILIFSLIIAVVLNSKFKGRALVRAIFFMPVIFNSQAVDIAMSTGAPLASATENVTADLFASMFNFSDFLVMANIPLIFVNFLSNATGSIYNVISYSGVQILIFLSGIQAVPKHLYEAAKMEGATQYEIFWKITFPMVSPLMLTTAVYTVVDSFLRSNLVNIIGVFANNKFIDLVNGLGGVTYSGIHAAMSWLFALSSILLISIVLIGISRMVFYYDE